MSAVLNPITHTELAGIDGAAHIPRGLLRPNPWNRQIDREGLPGLADTMRQAGVLQPLVVRPIDGAQAGEALYEIVCGERRWLASDLAELATVPCLVRPLDDQQVKELMLIENLQREGLHELDEAAGYDQLLRKDTGPQALRGFTSVDELAKHIGRSASYVAQRLRLLTLCPSARDAFRKGQLTFSLALRIARLPDQKDQAEATQQILRGWGGDPMTARQADEFIHRSFMLELDRAPFKVTDASLVPEAGACRDCSKRTGSNADLFPDIKKGDTCTDGACYRRKEAAHQAAVKAAAEARGLTVITGADAKKIKPNNYSAAKGYLELDVVHHQIHSTKPLRKLLGKAEVKTVMVEDPHSKQLVEMVDQKQATAALKAAGVLKTATLPGTTARQREENAKAKRETAWRTAVAEACLQQARGEPGAAPEYRAGLVQRVAIFVWGELHNDTRVRLVKLLGWPPLKARWDSGAGVTAEQHITSLDDAELCRYLTACTIVADTHTASYQPASKPEALLATAALLGVDVQACKDSVRELAKVTPDATAAKRAVKKAATLTPETALAQAMKKATKAPKAPAVRYRDPATGNAWSGRGLTPKWLKVALESGAKLSDFDTQAKPTGAGIQPADVPY